MKWQVDQTGGRTITRGCSVVFAGGLEEDGMEVGQGNEALELDGMASGERTPRGGHWTACPVGAHSLQPRVSPLSLTGFSRCKFLCPQLSNSAALVLLGYEPLLEGGTLRLTDLPFFHSTGCVGSAS